jgi:hypothetical protein
LLVVCAVVSVGTHGYISAQKSQMDASRSRANAAPTNAQTSANPDVNRDQSRARTDFNNGNSSVFVAASTDIALDQLTTAVCPGTSGTCNIQADMWVPNGRGVDKKANENDICLEVDGVASSGCLYTSGERPIDVGFVLSSSSQSITGLAPGTHTVQTFISRHYGAQLGYSNSTYRVYKA